MHFAVLSGLCDYKDPRFHLASQYILKLGEHTYGLNALGDNVNWTNANFEKARLGKWLNMLGNRGLIHSDEEVVVVEVPDSNVTLESFQNFFGY